ncbi:hypothetical protein X743_11980 [Mesorhizobium sp. LNHC252B00]|nr:hypothetical protein X743_11980 [Mesorhizobium sp. LNHC252B00]
MLGIAEEAVLTAFLENLTGVREDHAVGHSTRKAQIFWLPSLSSAVLKIRLLKIENCCGDVCDNLAVPPQLRLTRHTLKPWTFE